MDHEQIVNELKQDFHDRTKEIRMDILRIEEKLDTYSNKTSALEVSVGFITKGAWLLIGGLATVALWVADKYLTLLHK